jgi:YbgC/YbaW family acyl-CoA thioester hydrolase
LPGYSRLFTVHWNECDPARIVFHANFVRWMDEGFSDWAASLGIDFPALQAADPAFVGSPLVSVRCAFTSPARYGDVLEHRIGPAVIGGRSFRVPHVFEKNGVPVAEGEHVRIWGRLDPGEVLRALPIPADIAALLGAAPEQGTKTDDEA